MLECVDTRILTMYSINIEQLSLIHILNILYCWSLPASYTVCINIEQSSTRNQNILQTLRYILLAQSQEFLIMYNFAAGNSST